MYAVTFYGYLNPDQTSAAEEMGMRMYEAIQTAPGFIELKRSKIDALSELSIVYFDTEENVRNWYNDPRHREVMKAGRERVLRDYRIEVCEVKRAYTMQSSTYDARIVAETCARTAQEAPNLESRP
jgi:heme-degrading monooxygenase HmoA